MNEALRQLRDVHLPDAPSWWPPAPGWWLAALAMAVAAVMLARIWRTRTRRRLPLRAARAELHAWHRGSANVPTDGEFVDGANAIVRRAAIHGLGDTAAASLTGSRWLRYLDGIAGDDTISRGAGGVLGDDRFATRLEVDRDSLVRDLDRLLTRMEQRA